jgi:ZIP family zinc transporter
MDMLNISAEQFQAFQLSFYASMGTFAGGVLVVLLVLVFNHHPRSDSYRVLMGILQSFSAGVMLYITCFHLVPECVEDIGKEAMLWVFVGILVFGLLEWIVDYTDASGENSNAVASPSTRKRRSTRSKSTASPKKNSKADADARQLLRTSYITFVALFLHNLPEGLGVYLSSLSDQKMVRV